MAVVRQCGSLRQVCGSGTVAVCRQCAAVHTAECGGVRGGVRLSGSVCAAQRRQYSARSLNIHFPTVDFGFKLTPYYQQWFEAYS
jgi:hypothetical protein